MVSEGLRRSVVAGTLGLVVALLFTNHSLRCPIWQAGLPCPSCGVVRGIAHLVTGDIAAAFGANLLLPYWLLLGAGVLSGPLVYALGFTDDASAVGRRVLDAVPVPVHAWLFLVSEIANLMRFGLNPHGWLWGLMASN
jgi:Protein of unknown function (DUF2752)